MLLTCLGASQAKRDRGRALFFSFVGPLGDDALNCWKIEGKVG